MRDIADDVIVEIAGRYMAGRVEGQNYTFAPSLAEFSSKCRDLVDLRLKARAIPYRSPEVAREPLQAQQNRVRKKYEGRTILFDGINSEQFSVMAKRKEVPPGSEFVALIGTVYAPEAEG